MKLHIGTCLLLLGCLLGCHVLETAVPPDDATPEPDALTIKRTIPKRVAESLSTLWSGTGGRGGVSSDSAAIAAALAAADGQSAPGVDGYSQQLRHLGRSSSARALAAWTEAAAWVDQPWPRSSATASWLDVRGRLLVTWWRAEKVDFLRDPWRSAYVMLQGAGRQAAAAAREFWALVRPGGKLHPSALFESQGHLAVEAALIVILLALLAQRAYKPGTPHDIMLTQKEVDELCEEWQPEPLAGPVPKQRQGIEPPLISSDVGPYVVADGRRVLNFASLNFLGIAGDAGIRDICKRTIEKYGVGACGPRGFYGTIDVHLQLEERLAAFMGTQEAILYSYDLASLPSILPAFANKRDLIVCDEAVSFPAQNGALLSRAKVLYFKHNDMADLERVLQKVAADDLKYRKPLNRRYIVVEGIYSNLGDLAPLVAIAALKHKYKYRLIVDESLALGVLGFHGRGAVEAAGLAPSDVDIISCSLGNSLASVGGFCAGDREIVDHQRLSGLGYCFSAALPPYLATAATGALDKISVDGERLMSGLAANARRMRLLLSDVPGLELVGSEADAPSPLLHLRLASPAQSHLDSEGVLADVAAEALQRDGVLLAVHRLATNDRCAAQGANPLPPSLRVAVIATHSSQDLERGAAAIRRAATAVLQPKRKQPERFNTATSM